MCWSTFGVSFLRLTYLRLCFQFPQLFLVLRERFELPYNRLEGGCLSTRLTEHIWTAVQESNLCLIRPCLYRFASKRPLAGERTSHLYEPRICHFNNKAGTLAYYLLLFGVANQTISSPFLIGGLRRKPLATQLNMPIHIGDDSYRQMVTPVGFEPYITRVKVWYPNLQTRAPYFYFYFFISLSFTNIFYHIFY